MDSASDIDPLACFRGERVHISSVWLQLASVEQFLRLCVHAVLVWGIKLGHQLQLLPEYDNNLYVDTLCCIHDRTQWRLSMHEYTDIRGLVRGNVRYPAVLVW